MYSATVLADSITSYGVRLSTLEITIPRVVLAEFNTHRMFSRNSASSRAIPVGKQIDRILETPFVPYWTRNQPGMQGSEFLTGDLADIANGDWLIGRDHALEVAEMLSETCQIHKQDANRILEPWMWQTIIVSATDWTNYLKLRAPNEHSKTFDKDKLVDLSFPADPKIQPTSFLIAQALAKSIPQPLATGDWHLPLVRDKDEHLLSDGPGEMLDPERTLPSGILYKVLVSVGRCARVSYLTHAGERDPDADGILAVKLSKSKHWSPWEHAAQPMSEEEWEARKGMMDRMNSFLSNRYTPQDATSFLYSGNFMGWRQARKLFEGESGRGHL